MASDDAAGGQAPRRATTAAAVVAHRLHDFNIGFSTPTPALANSNRD
ncbi:hypothetical protein [Pseudarthrobacter sp. 1C304]